ncbi:hypothetical protein [Micromonospora sp. NPDC005367]|uniref:hypothetical protein n=1 Tax=Micromonospora sp. NPDC005367 TaxID=3155590 RepID=UPI0033B316AE
MSPFWYTAVRALSHLPSLLVLLTGLVLTGVARRRLPGRSRALMYTGLGLLMVNIGLGVGVSVVLPAVVADQETGSLGFDVVPLFVVSNLISFLLQPVGLGLVIAAALTGRRTPGSVPPAGPRGWPPLPLGPAAPVAAGPNVVPGGLPPLPGPAHPAPGPISGPVRGPDR